jgi:hypothetical protein
MKKEFILAQNVEVKERSEKESETAMLNTYVNLVSLGFKLTGGLN